MPALLPSECQSPSVESSIPLLLLLHISFVEKEPLVPIREMNALQPLNVHHLSLASTPDANAFQVKAS